MTKRTRESEDAEHVTDWIIVHVPPVDPADPADPVGPVGPVDIRPPPLLWRICINIIYILKMFSIAYYCGNYALYIYWVFQLAGTIYTVIYK